LIEVDLAGVRQIRESIPEGRTVFLSPPSWEELEVRLRGRGTEPHDVVARRLETAKVEMEAREEFDDVVVNDELEAAVDELVSLLVGRDRHLRTDSPSPQVQRRTPKWPPSKTQRPPRCTTLPSASPTRRSTSSSTGRRPSTP